MEWLSEEEKSRSMMPYLLDLPPLDSEAQQATVTEIHESKDNNKKLKSAAKKTKEARDIEMEKWHRVPTERDVPKPTETSIPCSDSSTYPLDCDTNKYCKFTYDLKFSKAKKFVTLADYDMDILRHLIKKKTKNNN